MTVTFSVLGQGLLESSSARADFVLGGPTSDKLSVQKEVGEVAALLFARVTRTPEGTVRDASRLTTTLHDKIHFLIVPIQKACISAAKSGLCERL